MKIVDEMWTPQIKSEEIIRNPHPEKTPVQIQQEEKNDHEESPDSDHTRPYSLGPDDIKPETEEAQQIENAHPVKPVISHNGPAKVPQVTPSAITRSIATKSINLESNGEMDINNNKHKHNHTTVNMKNTSGSTLEISRSRSPHNKTSCMISKTVSNFHTAKEKTQFFNNLVHVFFINV